MGAPRSGGGRGSKGGRPRDPGSRPADDGEVRWTGGAAAPEGEHRRSVHIALEGLEVRCHVGVGDDERREAQTLLVDVRLTPLVTSDYAADDLAGTIDYGTVAAVAVATAAERPYRLLERLATEIADRVWAGGELAELRVAVRKPAPPVGVPAAAACVEVVYYR
jgi:dihydroneopterin aldolase